MVLASDTWRAWRVAKVQPVVRHSHRHRQRWWCTDSACMVVRSILWGDLFEFLFVVSYPRLFLERVYCTLSFLWGTSSILTLFTACQLPIVVSLKLGKGVPIPINRYRVWERRELSQGGVLLERGVWVDKSIFNILVYRNRCYWNYLSMSDACLRK